MRDAIKIRILYVQKVRNTRRITRYFVYGFSSYDEMYSLVGASRFTNRQVISTGQKISTDNRTLYPGNYSVIIGGDVLSECRVDLTYNSYKEYKGELIVWSRPRVISVDGIEMGNEFIACNFVLTEIAKNFRVNITNTGIVDSTVDEIQILKDDVYYADFYSSKWINNGEDKDGVRYLYDGGVSFGPYIVLVPGVYIAECNGVGLEKILLRPLNVATFSNHIAVYNPTFCA